MGVSKFFLPFQNFQILIFKGRSKHSIRGEIWKSLLIFQLKPKIIKKKCQKRHLRGIYGRMFFFNHTTNVNYQLEFEKKGDIQVRFQVMAISKFQPIFQESFQNIP